MATGSDDTVTISELEKHHHLPQGSLDGEITSDHIREIARELDSWEFIASHLKLTKQQIEAIKEDNNSQEVKKLATLTRWQERLSFKATYKKLAETFLAIDRADLASKLCKIIAPKQNPAVFPPAPLTNSQQDHLSVDQTPSPCPFSPQASLEPTSPQSVNSGISVGSPPQLLTFTSSHPITKNPIVQELESKFAAVVLNVIELYTQSNVPVHKLKRITNNLSPDIKGELGPIFKKERSEISKAKSIEDLFAVLSDYWDYLQPDLLVYLVEQCENNKAKVVVSEYEKELAICRQKITLQEYIGKRLCNLDDKDRYQIAIRLGNDWHEKTLDDLERMRFAFADEFSLLRLVPKLHGLKPGSITVIFSLPKSVVFNQDQLVKFFQSYNPLQVMVDGVFIYSADEELRKVTSHSLSSDKDKDSESMNFILPEEKDGSSTQECGYGCYWIDKDGHESAKEPDDSSNQESEVIELGYGCQFIEQPPASIQSKCPVCLLILCEPYQVSCCGNSYCRVCIQRIKDSNKPCPTCKELSYTYDHDKSLQRSLHKYEVYCEYKEEGCDWTGKLGDFKEHLNENPDLENELKGCLFVLVACKFEIVGCKRKANRENMPEHLKADSKVHLELLKKSNKTLETDILFIEDQHRIAILSQQVYSLKNENTVKEKAMKELNQRYEQAMKDHEKELNTRTEKLQQEIDKMKQRCEQLQKQVTSQMLSSSFQASASVEETDTPTPPVTFTMNNYNKLKSDNGRWLSPVFYSHDAGYKMCLEVYPNGDKEFSKHHGTRVTIYIYFTKGEFDDHLKWPFRGYVVIKLLDQEENKSHHSRTITFGDNVPDRYTSRVTEGYIAQHGWGTHRFIPIEELKPTYLKNDCLKFEISRVVLDE